MDWHLWPMDRIGLSNARESVGTRRRWFAHAAHGAPGRPHQPLPVEEFHTVSRTLTIDGSEGEGGGQILRTSLSLSLLTGRAFRITKIRANRDKPGLRPQHLLAVDAAAALGNAEVRGASVGSRELTFRPNPYTPHDLQLDIGTAGSTALVLQTLHLPLALRAESPVRVALTGGTFNPKAPAATFLQQTWAAYLAAFGMRIALAMPAAGFYPRGGGQLEAWIEPAKPRAWIRTERGPLTTIRGVAGVANLRPEIAERMRDRALGRLAEHGHSAEIALADWPSPGQGAAISLTAEHEGVVPATFVGLGERGKPAETVADEAVDELLAFQAAPGAVDPHSADQILLPLALAEGHSQYSVTEVTEHLRTNVRTIGAFLERPIRIEDRDGDRPARVIVA